MYKYYKHYIDYLVLLNPQQTLYLFIFIIFIFKFNGITKQEWKN